MPPQPPRQTGLCYSNENKGAPHHHLYWVCLETERCMQETSSHLMCAESGFWECSCLFIFQWLWAVNSRISCLGSWSPLFSSTSNREKLPCFSKPAPPLPSNTDSLVDRREGTKAVREENTLLSSKGENRASLCSCSCPKALSLIWTHQHSFYRIWFSFIPEHWLLTTLQGAYSKEPL